MTARALVAAAYGALVQGIGADGREQFDALLGEGTPPAIEERIEAVLALGGEVG